MKTIIKTTLVLALSLVSIYMSAQKSSDLKTVVYECSFDCPSCEAKVMKNLPYEKGVKDVKVIYGKNLATVTYKTSKNSDEGIKSALEGLGYKVEIKGESHSFRVSGNCGMCKDKIETAAKSVQGVSLADWDKDNKTIHVVFNNSLTSVNEIHKAIANVGYDTSLEKAKDEVYNSLHECCKYAR